MWTRNLRINRSGGDAKRLHYSNCHLAANASRPSFSFPSARLCFFPLHAMPTSSISDYDAIRA